MQYGIIPIFLSSMATIQYVPCCPCCHWERTPQYCGTSAQSDRFTLHCQPRGVVFWQHTTTWYRKQPLYSCSRNIVRITTVSEAKRHTRCGWTICTLFSEHKGASVMTTTRQRNNVVAELHSTRTPMWTGSRLGQLSFPTRLSWNLAWHARSVHWMYLQAHNKHKHNDKQHHDT